MPAPFGSKNGLKHGGKGTKLYDVWSSMKGRCFNKNHKAYYRYGARGITVCDEWLDFENFQRWAKSSGYNRNLSIERKNNDGNYEPANCRWATTKEQANNTRENSFITAFGDTKTVAQWVSDPRCTVTDTCLRRRVKAGMLPEQALTQQSLRKGK